MKKIIRVAALGGAVALALAACGSAPEETSESAGGETSAATVDFKACMVSDAGGFDDKSFNQAGFEGLTQAEDELGIEIAQRRVRRRHRLHAEHRQPGRRGLRPDHRRRLPARGPDPGAPPRRTRTSNFALVDSAFSDADFAPVDAGQRQADPVRHGAGRLPRRLRRRGDDHDRQGRDLRRHPDPVRHDLHGRLRRRHRQVQRGQRRRRRSCSAGTRPAQQRRLRRQLRQPGRRQEHRPVASSTRARTSSCPSPVRSVWARASVAQAGRQRLDHRCRHRLVRDHRVRRRSS